MLFIYSFAVSHPTHSTADLLVRNMNIKAVNKSNIKLLTCSNLFLTQVLILDTVVGAFSFHADAEPDLNRILSTGVFFS